MVPRACPCKPSMEKYANHGMVHHYSGTTLEAQKRYADGIKNCLVKFLNGRPIERDYLIVDDGKVVSPSYQLRLQKRNPAIPNNCSGQYFY